MGMGNQNKITSMDVKLTLECEEHPWLVNGVNASAKGTCMKALGAAGDNMHKGDCYSGDDTRAPTGRLELPGSAGSWSFVAYQKTNKGQDNHKLTKKIVCFSEVVGSTTIWEKCC